MKIGFDEYAEKFASQMVDGDLLLLLGNDELANDIGLTSGLMRKRFLRELAALKVMNIIQSTLDNWNLCNWNAVIIGTI